MLELVEQERCCFESQMILIYFLIEFVMSLTTAGVICNYTENLTKLKKGNSVAYHINWYNKQ